MTEKFRTPERVEKQGRGYVLYKTTCDCIGNDHNITMALEEEKEEDGTRHYGAAFYFNSVYCAKYSVSWMEKSPIRWCKIFWNKVKAIFKIIFKGYIETSDEIIFDNPEHLRDMATMLNHFADEMEK